MSDVSVRTPIDWADAPAVARRRRRHLADRRLRFYGLTAISIAIGLLAILVSSLVMTGYSAFQQTMVTLDYSISAEHVSAEEPKRGNFRAIIAESFRTEFPDVESSRDVRALAKIPTNNAQFMLRDA